MTDPGRPIGDDDLHAYIDGQLDAERRGTVERYLVAHPEIAQRWEAYARQREELGAALAWKAEEPVPAALNIAHLVEARVARRQVPWRWAAAILLSLGVGAVGGWGLRGSTPPSGLVALADESLAAHRVFVADRQHPIEFDGAHRADLAKWVAVRLDRPVAPPDLSASGYRFMGGRVIATPHGAAAFFMYDDDKGTRLTLTVRPMAVEETVPMRSIGSGADAGIAWVNRGLGYALVGKAPDETLLPLAEEARRQSSGAV